MISVPLDEVIDVLRSAEADTGPTPTVPQVHMLIDDIWAMRDLAVTAARPEMAPLTELDLVSIAELFGKHRARVLKQDLTGKLTRKDSGATGMLLPPTEDEVREVRALIAAGIAPYRADGSKNVHVRNKNAIPRRLAHAVDLGALNWGALPVGYDRDSWHRRDVHASLSAVLAQPATDAEIIRFVERTYSTPALALEADHVRLVHWLVSHHLEAKLLELVAQTIEVQDGHGVVVPCKGTTHAPLARLLARAYDLLEVARADAVTAFTQVADGQVNDPAPVRGALIAAQWLAPGSIGKLLALTERVLGNPDNTRLAHIFTTALATFRHTARSTPGSYIVRSVAEMSDAHLTMVLTQSGLEVDGGEERAAANELRSRLIEMGLRNDLDRELPEALRAWHSGRLEEFYSSRQARLDGDPDWVRLYDLEMDAELAPQLVS